MARREKKSKINLKIWVPVICIAVVGVTFYMMYDIQNKIDKMEGQNAINQSENEIIDNETNHEENITNQDVVNETTNTTENISSNNISNNTTSNKINNQTSNQSQPGITDKKQKAIELVKKKWGKDDTVNYVFDYVNENGEYVVAVKDKATATVKYYFRVNLETETVELD